MSIIRTKKDKGYFAVSNEPFNDSRLSWEARGMMGYLLSKPDGWIVHTGDLLKQTKAKRHVTQRIINELKAAGYLRRFREQDESGKLVWITEVYERCDLNPEWNTSSDGLSFRSSEVRTFKNPIIKKPDRIISTDPIVSTDEKEADPIAELAGHFTLVTGLLANNGVWRDEWELPLSVLLKRAGSIDVAKAQIDRGWEFAKKGGKKRYTVKSPASLMTIIANLPEEGELGNGKVKVGVR